MAGRGRGRGASMSFNPSQLGFAPGDIIPVPVLQPPPTYPTPDNRALPIDLGEAGDYLLFLKQKYSAFMRDAPSFLEQVIVTRDVQRYADRYQAVTAKSAAGGRGINQAYYPEELRKIAARRKRKSAENGSSLAAKSARKTVDINGRLEELEQREKAGVDLDETDDDIADAGEDGNDADGDADGEDEEGGEELDEEDLDEEMDDGTDYINSYFDNGEDYGDEDDDLDDGPTY